MHVAKVYQMVYIWLWWLQMLRNEKIEKSNIVPLVSVSLNDALDNSKRGSVIIEWVCVD